jgi:hypothetical protein
LCANAANRADILRNMGRGGFPQPEAPGADPETPSREAPTSMPQGTSKGFNDEDIERMESYKSPIKDKPPE